MHHRMHISDPLQYSAKQYWIELCDLVSVVSKCMLCCNYDGQLQRAWVARDPVRTMNLGADPRRRVPVTHLFGLPCLGLTGSHRSCVYYFIGTTQIVFQLRLDGCGPRASAQARHQLPACGSQMTHASTVVHWQIFQQLAVSTTGAQGNIRAAKNAQCLLA